MGLWKSAASMAETPPVRSLMKSLISALTLHLIDTPFSDLLPAHPVSFAHNFVSGMQSFNFSESQDAIVLQTCH